MIAIDTNILLRILVDDPDAPGQNTAARALAAQAETVFVPLLAVVETIWVIAAMNDYRSETIDFADGVMLEIARRRDLSLHTFDRKLGRLENVSLLK